MLLLLKDDDDGVLSVLNKLYNFMFLRNLLKCDYRAGMLSVE